MRKWELATQYRISNIAETFIALSSEIGTALKYWKTTSSLENIPISGITTGDATPFVPDPTIWRGLEAEGRSRIILYTNKKLYRQIVQFYTTHYPRIEELGRDFRKSLDSLKTEWAEIILKTQDPSRVREDKDQLRRQVRNLVEELIQREAQGYLFIEIGKKDLINKIADSIDHRIGDTPAVIIKDPTSLAESLYESAAPKIKIIHDGINSISEDGFQEDADGLLELIRDKIGNPV